MELLFSPSPFHREFRFLIIRCGPFANKFANRKSATLRTYRICQIRTFRGFAICGFAKLKLPQNCISRPFADLRLTDCRLKTKEVNKEQPSYIKSFSHRNKGSTVYMPSCSFLEIFFSYSHLHLTSPQLTHTYFC